MSLNDSTYHAIWSILQCFINSGDALKSQNIAREFYLNENAMSQGIYDLVAEVAEHGGVDSIIALGLGLVREYLLRFPERVILIAFLRAQKQINLTDALNFLGQIDNDEYISGEKNIKRLIDIVWLVREDQKDGILKVEDDELFAEALDAFL